MKICLLILLLSSVPLFPQQANVDSLLNQLSISDASEREKIELAVTAILYNTELDEGKKISDYLIKVLRNSKFQKLYVMVLVHSWRFHSFDGKIKLLNEAYTAAKKLKDYKLVSTVEIFKAIAFRDNSMTDSAMTYALRARDTQKKTGKQGDSDEVINLIADLYYYAGQYDKAEALYRQLMSEESVKGSWRYNTLQDDLGLIRIKQKRYPEAERYFKKTLDTLTSKKMQHPDSTALPYQYRMLLQISFLQKHYEDAEKYYYTGKLLTERFELQEYLPAFYAYKGGLCLAKGERDSALVFYRKALELHRSTPNFDDAVNIYDGLSKTYTAKNDPVNANHYLKLLNHAQAASDSVFYRARYMTTFAEYNYNNYLSQIASYKERQTFLVIFILVMIVSLVTIAYFLIRLGRANRKLIAKNIELAKSGENIAAPPEAVRIDRPSTSAGPSVSADRRGLTDRRDLTGYAKSNESELLQQEPAAVTASEDENKKESKKLDEDFIRDLIYRLDKLMQDEKIYLRPEISMDHLSDLLKTNRTYLSRAINSAYNINFATYINDLRIKEAVRIISGGEHKNFSIEGIAQKAGFNNRVSFTTAFYKHTGVSPSYFIKHAEESVKSEKQ